MGRNAANEWAEGAYGKHLKTSGLLDSEESLQPDDITNQPDILAFLDFIVREFDFDQAQHPDWFFDVDDDVPITRDWPMPLSRHFYTFELCMMPQIDVEASLLFLPLNGSADFAADNLVAIKFVLPKSENLDEYIVIMDQDATERKSAPRHVWQRDPRSVAAQSAQAPWPLLQMITFLSHTSKQIGHSMVLDKPDIVR